ncbi:MAG: AAA family ATPase [Bacteroidales bacterium]
MKILAIRGKNLASLEREFSIDFKKPPLSESRIFVITGKTGAGKSTILDALCLALYDKTPRTSNVSEKISIKDVNEQTIFQDDSRTTLRKGAGEGFAQVDFQGIDKKEYRSTWKVRRAHGKPDGALQSTEMTLENLTDGVYEKGTKSEIQKKIVLLVGLTFEQFTRSVLLSQGDFASFLRARQPEKAELLEKITGTHIYTQISQLIYSKHKEIKTEFEYKSESANENKNKLLKKEELEQLLREHQYLNLDIENIQNSINLLKFKLDWYNNYQIFYKRYLEANEKFEKSKQAKKQINQREKHIKVIEDVRVNIKDQYQRFEKNKGLINDKELNLEEQNEDLRKNENKLLLIEQTLEKLKNEKQKLITSYEKIKIDIDEAKKLDYDIENKSKLFQEENADFIEMHDKFLYANNELQQTNIEIDRVKILISNFENWFNKNNRFEILLEDINLLKEYINSFNNISENLFEINVDYKKSKVKLDEIKNQLNESEEKLKHLEKYIPSEVKVIQEKLSDGDLCPVCGNVYHKKSTEISDNILLRHEEINNEKKMLSEKISLLKNNQNELIRKTTVLESKLDDLTNSQKNVLSKLEAYKELPSNWMDLLNRKKLIDTLSDFNNTWKNKKDSLSKLQNQLNDLNLKATLLENKLKDKDEIEKKRLKVEFLNNELKECKTKRLLILEGKSVIEVENSYQNQKNECETNLNNKIDEKLDIAKNVERIRMTIKQSDNELDKLRIEQNALIEQISNWLNKNSITTYELKKIVEVDDEWLDSEKADIELIKNEFTFNEATLKERLDNLNNHINNKPEGFVQEDIDKNRQKNEILSNDLKEKSNKRSIIEARLIKNNELKKEYDEKINELKLIESDLENWSKLNDLLGSASGNTFKLIAQQYTLDILLNYTNHHLNNLAKRYVLERVDNTLALNIIDRDMFNEVRTVFSLSGGETFLISLSLALGLSSISSNMMKVETLFIDEGFGSLDKDTLNVAIDALEMLQNQGRRIGIISHVGEISERVQARINVVKENNGKSVIEICST